MLPLSRISSVFLSGVGEPSRVLDRLAAALRRKAGRVVSDAGGGAFDGGGFWGWDLLLSVGWGRVEPAGRAGGVEVRYRLVFVPYVVLITVVIGFVGALVALNAPPAVGPVRFVAPVAAWVWFVGGSIAVTLVRFRAFVRRAATGSGPGT